MKEARSIRKGTDPKPLGPDSWLDLALAFVATRKAVGLSQAALARRAAWKPQFACRLESLRARPPNLTTVVRYARACNVDVGLMFAIPRDRRLYVVRAATLQSAGNRRAFERLSQKTLRAPPLTPIRD